MTAHTTLAPHVERTLILEVYDDFPSALVVASRCRNLGIEELRLERVVSAQRRLNAALAAEKGQGRYNRFQHKLSKVVAEHPDRLILNKEGAHARLSRNLAVLCPASPR